MQAEDAIMDALKTRPMSQRELCLVTGYTDRHIRRILRDLPISSRRSGRSIVYSSTTTGDDTGHDPETPDMTPDIPASEGHPSKPTQQRARNTGHVRYPTPDIPDIRQDRTAKKKKTSKPASNTGHFQPTTADIPGINTGHSGHFDPGSSPSRAPIPERTGTMHRKTHDPEAEAGPYSNCPADCTDHTCRSCPLSIATLERDTIQFVLVDKQFRDQLMRWADTRKWPHRESRGVVWLYPGDHLTLQVGVDTTTFYSDEPGEDLGWIETWVRRYFDAIYPDIDGLLARIRSPERLTRDELTVVVTHQPTIDAIMASIGMHMGPNKTFYLKAPNSNSPGFKAYQHAGTLRMEFDCRNQFQAISALDMRQRLLTILPEVRRAEGLFWEFLTDYYNPYEHPIVIDTGVDAILQQFQNLAQTLTDRFTDALRDLQQQPTPRPEDDDQPDIGLTEDEIDRAQAAVAAMMDDLKKMDQYDLDEIFLAFKRHLKLDEQAAYVFLSAFAAWTARRYRGRVLMEDVSHGLQGAGAPLDLAAIADAVDHLKTAGLMRNHPKLEICFSTAGKTLGKKLLAKWEGVR